MEEQGAGVGGLVYNPRVWSMAWGFILAVAGTPCVNPVGEAWVSCLLLRTSAQPGLQNGSFLW